MAREYAKVLDAMDRNYTAVGRSKEKTDQFNSIYPNKAISGGLEEYLQNSESPKIAIVAVNVEYLFLSCKLLLEKGCKQILLEKPGAIEVDELKELNRLAEENKTNVFIAYNRRFHKSVELAKQFILQDGGISSIQFEFTEWIHTIVPEDYPNNVLNKWILANSTHVIDLTFHLAGTPLNINCLTSGENRINWHPSSSMFTGYGLTKKNIPFSYHTNWLAPGRWAIEILTEKRRLYLKPMERLFVQQMGSIKVEESEYDYSLDTKFKPGLFNMVNEFLNNTENSSLCLINEHLSNTYYYYKIAGY